MYQFQKKDGTMEDYDQSKIAAGILKAGGTQENADAIVASIEAWLPSVVLDNVVKASDIRSKVIEELKLVNPTAAASFESYHKTEGTVVV